MADLIEQIKADREAGTPGPWFHTHVRGRGASDTRQHVAARDHDACDIAGDCPILVAHMGASHWETKFPAEVNARRAARVPVLEEIALAAARYVELRSELESNLSRARTKALDEAFYALLATIEAAK